MNNSVENLCRQVKKKNLGKQESEKSKAVTKRSKLRKLQLLAEPPGTKVETLKEL